MLYREIIAVCSEIHTKHINTLCGQNVELLNVKPGGKYGNRWALEMRGRANFSCLYQLVPHATPAPAPQRDTQHCWIAPYAFRWGHREVG
jgi:hypothetical protein